MTEIKIKVLKNKIEIIRKETSIKRINAVCKPRSQPFICHGLYGSIGINDYVYLIFVTKRHKEQPFRGCEVYQILEVEIIQLKGSIDTNNRKIGEIKSFFRMPGIYYSDYPLYRESSVGKSDETDFLFNYTPLQSLKKHCPELEELSIKCIQGYYGCQQTDNVTLYLISRRCWRRIGSRFFSRGSSSKGYVSNYVETELFLCRDGLNYSFIQVRGSIPLVWFHIVGLKYNPQLIIHKEHFFTECNNILEQKYNEVFYLNLIKNRTYEKPIHDLFTMYLIFKRYNYVHFDVHEKGSFRKEEVHHEFLSKIEDFIVRCGFKNAFENQKGVIRTNCIDCLDRTNLCQFIISQEVLKRMCVDCPTTVIENCGMKTETFYLCIIQELMPFDPILWVGIIKT